MGSVLLVVAEHVARHLENNDIVYSLRPLCKATAAQFRRYSTARLSQPVPPAAFMRRWAAPGAMRPLTLHQRRRLLVLTAASGCTSNLELAMEHAGILLTARDRMEMLHAAAAAGQLDACRWMLQHGFPVSAFAAAEAARAGRRDVVEFLIAHGGSWGLHIVREALRGGHPDLADWLLQQHPGGLPDDVNPLTAEHGVDICTAAAEGCTLATLQALHARYPYPADQPFMHRFHHHNLVQAAARSPTPDWRAKLEWLESIAPADFEREASVCQAAAAAASGDALDRLIWLVQRGYAVGGGAAAEAASRGDLPALEYVLEQQQQQQQGDQPGVTLATTAARAGQLAALQALHARGCPVRQHGEEVALEAARGGHLPVLVWAVEELQLGTGTLVAVQEGDGGGDSLGAGLLDAAAGSGGVELMAWLLERGCGWSEGGGAVEAAAKAGCEEALEWMAAQGCPMPTHGLPYLRAAEAADLATLRCLRRLGCPADDPRLFAFCLERGVPLPLLRWLAEAAGAPVDWEAALEAAPWEEPDGPSGVRAWLEEQREQEQEREQEWEQG